MAAHPAVSNRSKRKHRVLLGNELAQLGLSLVLEFVRVANLDLFHVEASSFAALHLSLYAALMLPRWRASLRSSFSISMCAVSVNSAAGADRAAISACSSTILIGRGSPDALGLPSLLLRPIEEAKGRRLVLRLAP